MYYSNQTSLDSPLTPLSFVLFPIAKQFAITIYSVGAVQARACVKMIPAQNNCLLSVDVESKKVTEVGDIIFGIMI